MQLLHWSYDKVEPEARSNVGPYGASEYLRQFARPGTSDHQISAELVGRLDVAFTTGTRKIEAQQGFC
jgi:hypothetical protein